MMKKVLNYLFNLSKSEKMFIVGGAVRDILIGKSFNDLDLVVERNAEELAKRLAKDLGFTFVELSREFGVYRVANPWAVIDISLQQGETIEEDLKLRDFTINAMAIPVESLFEDRIYFIDPFLGYVDLKEKRVRGIAEENIVADPLRILRGYRLFAKGYGLLERKTREWFAKHAKSLILSAPERIFHELELILLTDRAYEAFCLMDEDGVLEVIFPEVNPCRNVPQPEFHHLDVWGHMLESLKWAEAILKDPEAYLGRSLPKDLKEDKDFIISVKLASIFHDLGKGYTFKQTEEGIVFYGHEKVSSDLALKIAERLRFKRDLGERIALLVKSHMRPCQLFTEFEKGALTIRAKRNLIKDVPYLWELFIVAMADSLASRGVDKEPDYEDRLRTFFHHLFSFKEEVERVEKRERVLTGRDLIELGFKPGPIFSEILTTVELKVLEGEIKTKKDAVEFVLAGFA
jgi:poly(A) polymerase